MLLLTAAAPELSGAPLVAADSSWASAVLQSSMQDLHVQSQL